MGVEELPHFRWCGAFSYGVEEFFSWQCCLSGLVLLEIVKSIRL